MATTTDTLLTERLDDLRDDQRGTVANTVTHLLHAAWDALYERRNHDVEGYITALSHVDTALEVLTAYRSRLAALRAQECDAEYAQFVDTKR